jgi:hypothetical protein
MVFRRSLKFEVQGLVNKDQETSAMTKSPLLSAVMAEPGSQRPRSRYQGRGQEEPHACIFSQSISKRKFSRTGFQGRRPRLFRSDGLSPVYPGYGRGSRAGRPDCAGNHRHQAGAGHIQEHIVDTGAPGGVKPLPPLVRRGIEQAKPPRPEAGAPRPISRIAPESLEPKKIHQAVGHDVAGFPEAAVD